MRKAILGALVFSVFTAAQASAVTIDFTDDVWDPCGSCDTKTVGNTSVEAFGPGSETLTWDDSNGFGVNSDGNDSSQIDDDEYVQVSFANLAFQLTSFSLRSFGSSEDAYFRVRTSSGWSGWADFGGTSSGNKTVTLVNPTWITALQIGFPDGGDKFYLKSLVGDWQQTTTNPPAVPEPTSMVLLGTGLAGLVARARRKRA